MLLLSSPIGDHGGAVLSQHKAWPYLYDWLGMREVGTLEPKPGVEPTSNHLAELLKGQQSQGARMVLRAAYQAEGPSNWLASMARISPVLLPYTVGGTPEAGDLVGLFDDTLNRLLKGLRE